MAPDRRRVERKPHDDIVQEKKGKKEDKNTNQLSGPLANEIYYG